jgi:hypothetical protein
MKRERASTRELDSHSRRAGSTTREIAVSRVHASARIEP